MTPDSPTTLPPIGAHVSIAGGLARAVERGREIDATALQVFTGQPRGWAEPDLDDADVEAFRHALEASEIRVAGAHDSYLINLASHREELYRKSVRAFRAELDRCARLGLDFLVTHPGNATGGDRPEALERNARAVAEAIRDRPGPTRVLLETTAGSGTALGWRFREIAALLEALLVALPANAEDRVGVCLDTAHVYAAGYDLAGNYDGVMDRFDRVVGLERLHLLHVNDSRASLGSRVDRHAHIGEGEMGEEAFVAVMRDPRTAHVPRVLETPKDDAAAESDRRNLAVLRRLAGADPAAGP